MAKRPIFRPDPEDALVEERFVEFEWFPGFAAVQKQRSIEALHAAAITEIGLTRLLEVSTKSPEHLGVRLSAFNLFVELPGTDRPVILEAAFQGSKVFAGQGPFVHLYGIDSGREVKRYMKELPADRLIGFRLAGHDWDLSPRTAFYDWLYLSGLRRLAGSDDAIDEALISYDAFTDIEFNPQKSINCQARSCALYSALLRNGVLGDALSDPESFIAVLRDHGYGIDPEQGQLL